MPNVTMPNGFVVYDVPDGTTQRQLMSRLEAAGYDMNQLLTPKQEKGVVEDYLEEVPVIGDMLTGAADIGLGAVQGLAGLGGAAAEAFGADNATAGFFDDIAKGAQDLMSAEERGDLAAGQRAIDEAKDKGIWEQVKAAAYAFRQSPATLTAQALGSAVPFIAATAATGGSAAAPLALGALTGAGAVKGSIYDAVEQAAVEKGIDPKTAKAMADEAQSYLGENADQVALGGVLGAVAGRFGIEGGLARVLGKDIAEAAVERSLIGGATRGVVAESIPEAGQAAQERMAQNIALQREGYDVPLMRGVAGQAALEGIMGGVPGAITGAFDRTAPAATPEERLTTGRATLEGVLGDEEATAEERDAVFAGRVRELEDLYGDPDFALELATAERDEIQARRDAAAAADARTVPDGGEPSVPEPDGGIAGGGPAPESAGPAAAGMGPAGVSPVEPIAREGAVESPLEPASVIPPIETVSPEAQLAEQLAPISAAPAAAPAVEEAAPEVPSILTPKMPMKERAALAMQMVEDTVMANPELQGQLGKTYAQVARQIAQSAAKGELLDPYETLKTLIPEATPTAVEVAPAAVPTPVEEAVPTPVEEAPKVELSPAMQELQAFVDENNPGFEVRYRPDKAKKYAFGVPGQKDLGYSTTIGGLRNKVLKEPALKIKETVDGVAVREMPAAKAPEPEPLSRQAFGEEYEDPAGALNKAQLEQISLLTGEIDEARKAREINDGDRTELVNMLRTPSERDLMRDTTWRLADTYQKQIDMQVKEGRKLGKEENALAKVTGRTLKEAVAASKRKKNPVPLSPEEADLRARIETNAKRTKELGDKLLETKQVIYDKVRNKLGTKRKEAGERAKRRATAKRNFERKFIDKGTYERIMRETALPDAVRYRKGRGEAKGVQLSAVNDAVKAITSRWKVPLKVSMVQSVADLPTTVQSALESDDRLDAFGFLRGDTVYLVADNLSSLDDVAPTLFHEALGHLGLRRAFRESLDDVLTSIYQTNKKIADATDKWMAENPDAYASDEDPLARAVEEVLAETSEGGPLSASKFDKLVRFLREAMRRVFGFDLKITDGEVRTILAMAHEQAIEGEGPAVGSSSILYTRKAAEEQDKAQAEVLNSSAQTTKGMDKIQMSADRVNEAEFNRGVVSGLSEAINARNVKEWIKGFAPSRMRSQFLAGGGLAVLPTDGMLDYAESVLGEGNPAVNAMREAADNMDRLNATRSTMRRALSRTVKDLKEFILKHGNNVLGDTMYYGNYYNIDMTKFTKGMSNEDAFKTDGVWRRYSKLLKNPDLDAKKRADFTAKQEQRQAEILEGMQAWGKLGELQGGQNLYKRVRDMHRDMYNSRRHLIKKYIENLKDAGVSEEAVSKMMKAYQEQYERLNNVETIPDAEEAHKDYPEVPLGLFHREYFPKRRFGKYWLRMKKTKVGEPVLQFFTTMAERDAALATFAEEMGFDPAKAESNPYYDLGNDAQRELSGEFEGVNTNIAFNRALNLLSGIDPENFTETTKQKLQADVYQLFLMASPEGSVRKQFIKSKNRLGWSQDILQIVGETAEEYATDISRLRFGQKVDQALRNARAASDSVPRAEKMVASDFIGELEQRVTGEMQPQTEGLANKIVPWMNQFAFVSFLTAPATALVQLTALPIRVAPNLWGKYGMAATTKAMARYTNVFNNRPKLERRGTESKSFRIATLRESNVVKNSKRHQDALRRATDEFGIVKPLSEFTMHGERTPGTAAQGKRAETIQKAYDFMTYLFDTTEQLTREATFMATYDLEYEKLAGENISAEERQNRAILAAKDTVNYTLGNYTDFNRPRFMKSSELAKALFLFKQYSVVTTRFFFTSMRTMFGKGTPRAERVAAMKEATGVLGMSFMFGGVVGLPLYSLGMMALQALQDATDDDEDRKERMRQNPMTADSVEMQFRYEWLPKHFGGPTATGKGDKDYSLSDIVLNGPVSELSGWNFGSRVSLDFTGLWFRAPKEADTWTGTVNNALVENIPGASASLNMVAMGEEFSKGNIADGLQVGMPAAVRGMVKAYNLSQEGLRTKSEKVRLRAEEIDNSEIIGTVLGFNPTQIAKVQQQTRDILGRTKDLQDTKSELLGNYTRAVRRIRNGDADGYDEARKAMQKIEDYNRKIGNPYLGISYTNIMNSLRGSISEEKYDVQGMGLNQIEEYYVGKTIGSQ